MNRFDRLPVRWRLAITSAGLTFVILLLFAVLVEMVTVSRIRSDFDSNIRASAQQISDQINAQRELDGTVRLQTARSVIRAATAGGAGVRVLNLQGQVVNGGSVPPDAPSLGAPSYGINERNGYRVVVRGIEALGHPIAFLQYGKPQASLDNTVGRVR